MGYETPGGCRVGAVSPGGSWPPREEAVITQLDEGITADSDLEGGIAYGAHLPLIDLAGRRSLPALKAYARTAAALGFRYLCANDHLIFSRPWLDGPTALAAVVEDSGDMRLAMTASLPVVRGPVQLAKTLVAIDILSGGRLVVGVGPGSSAADYAAAGVRFDERWRRFDEAVRVLRALLHGDAQGFEGEFYWPLDDEVRQLELFRERVVPLVPRRP